jgi:addiction module RelE/StbE family toxin
MIVRLREEAYADLAGIQNWISEKSPRAGREIIDRILEELERLGRFPLLGHAGRVRSTREWIVPRLPYIIVYRVDASADELVVIGVFHAAQDRDNKKR